MTYDKEENIVIDYRFKNLNVDAMYNNTSDNLDRGIERMNELLQKLIDQEGKNDIR